MRQFGNLLGLWSKVVKMKELRRSGLTHPQNPAHRLLFHLSTFNPPEAGETPMTNVSRVVKDNEDLPADILELGDALLALPAEHRRLVEPLYQRVLESTKRRRRILTLVQDALSQLRLDMKYLMFDLEATRRERDKYRGRLEEK